MVSLTSHIRTPLQQHPTFVFNPKHRSLPRFNVRPRRFSLPLVYPSINAAASFISNSLNQPPQQQPPRTLFPGGYKRPSIKVPNLVLQLSCEEVLEDNTRVLDIVDGAVGNQVGIVVLNGGGGSGGKLYEAACLLKSVIRERAYLIIDERVDIAAAVNANGVLLSDQGLPAIVARNMMIDSKSESVFLPLVARNVQSTDAALDASKAEGADFLIYSISGDRQFEDLVSFVLENVRVPTFIMIDSLGSEKSLNRISHILKSGVSGLVISLQELKVFGSDGLSKLFANMATLNKGNDGEVQSSGEAKVLDVNNGFDGKLGVAGFTKLEERERLLIETERSFLLEAIDAFKRAAPLMEEVSLLIDAVSQLDDPFLLVIVGEFNSGKSTVINALLGDKYLKDGVVPTTNEITFLRYSGMDVEQQHCERHPDGEYACYLPAPVLKEITIVDTPGTNVILQRQQRLTEEFVPRADLVLFVLSADRPLSESEVAFLHYIQQWKKKVVFVLNKSDLYQSSGELEEAISFVKENARKLLNVETVILYPVSARSALEAKLSCTFDVLGKCDERLITKSTWKISSFHKLEKYLYSFLDSTTSTGTERMKLKLGTPLRIAEKLLYSCQKIVRAECEEAKQDLSSVDKLFSSIEQCAWRMKSESISWERQVMSKINTAQARVIKLVESTLQLSNLDIVTNFAFKGENSTPMPVTSVVRNDIIDPALSEVQELLGEYRAWLQSSNTHEGKAYKEAFEKRWTLYGDLIDQVQLSKSGFPGELCESSAEVLGHFSAAAASKLFEQEIREVFLGTFGGLGAAGLSASLLTSVLPSTLEDLLALGLCSAGGLLAISNFPSRRQQVVRKVKRTVDALACKIEEAMQKDLEEAIENLEKYVKFIGKPYQEKMQQRLAKLSGTLDELTDIENNLETLQMEIENFHIL